MKKYINEKFKYGFKFIDYIYLYCLLSFLFFGLILSNVIKFPEKSIEIYKKISQKDYINTIYDAEFAIGENNFRIVNRINIGLAIQERKGSAFPRNEVILFCNLTIAEEMLELEPDYINYCPYKITVTETLNLDKKVIISTRLLPTNTKSKNLNEFSINMNEILQRMVEYAASDDPFIF